MSSSPPPQLDPSLPFNQGNSSMWSGIYPDVAAVMANNLVAGISNLKFIYLIYLFICGALFYKNFTLDLVKEQKWGARGEDGLWNGMPGGLQVLNQKKKHLLQT